MDILNNDLIKVKLKAHLFLLHLDSAGLSRHLKHPLHLNIIELKDVYIF